MKKTVIVTLIAIIIFTLWLSVGDAAIKPTKADAAHIIGRTAAVVYTAQKVAAQGGKFNRLGLAVAHQVYARDLYYEGFIAEAIFHSLRSRVLAAGVISQNKSGLLNEALYDRVEERYARESPGEQSLDQKLRNSKRTIMTDQSAAEAGVQLDLD